MTKDEAIKFYSRDVPAPRYGDKTEESLENCYDQTMERVNAGEENWDGCIGKAKCCRFFDYKFNLLDLDDELSKAHFAGDKGQFPVSLNIAHKCNQLDDNDKCGIYENRPQPCKEYYCQASKVRRNMFLRIKNPQIAKAVDEAEKKVYSEPKGTSAKQEDTQDND